MSSTSTTTKLCPVCKRAALTTNEQNEKYCIMCGYKVPPYTETVPIANINFQGETFVGNMIPRMKYKAEPQVREDGIYIPETEYVYQDCEPGYRLVLSKEMFIEAYIKWIVPLLPSIEEHFKKEE